MKPMADAQHIFDGWGKSGKSNSRMSRRANKTTEHLEKRHE